MNIQKEKGESRFATLAPHIPGTRTREPSTFSFNIDHQINLLIETLMYSSFPFEGLKHFHRIIFTFPMRLGPCL